MGTRSVCRKSRVFMAYGCSTAAVKGAGIHAVVQNSLLCAQIIQREAIGNHWPATCGRRRGYQDLRTEERLPGSRAGCFQVTMVQVVAARTSSAQSEAGARVSSPRRNVPAVSTTGVPSAQRGRCLVATAGVQCGRCLCCGRPRHTSRNRHAGS